jgi:TRAP-type uncharacterized transport system substrate-binding protein
MKKLVSILLIVLVLSIVFTGCSKKEAAASKTFVTIGTGGVTGVYYPTGGAIFKMVNQKYDEYGIKATVESTGVPYLT